MEGLEMYLYRKQLEEAKKYLKPETIALKNLVAKRNNEALKQELISRIGEEGLKPCKSKWPTTQRGKTTSLRFSQNGFNLSDFKEVHVIDNEIYQVVSATGELVKCKISKRKDYPTVSLVMLVNGNIKQVACHKVVASYYNDGVIYAGTYVDHKNGDRSDFRAENLRIVSPAQNNRNRPQDRELIRYSNSIEGNVLL